MAGYSGTPLPKKLGIKEGSRVAFSGAPAGFDRTLGDLPADVQVKRAVRGPLDVIVFFITRRLHRDSARHRDVRRIRVPWDRRHSRR